MRLAPTSRWGARAAPTSGRRAAGVCRLWHLRARIRYDDFAGVNVAGKVVMVLKREPQEGDPQSRFMGGFNTVHAYNSGSPK